MPSCPMALALREAESIPRHYLMQNDQQGNPSQQHKKRNQKMAIRNNSLHPPSKTHLNLHNFKTRTK